MTEEKKKEEEKIPINSKGTKAAIETTLNKNNEKDLEYIKSKILKHENFPKNGILFYDIFPALRDAKCLDMMVNRLLAHLYCDFGNDIDVICGLDSRGFLFGPILSLHMGISFVPIRKQGKLPGKCIALQSTKEYGGDILEIQEDAIKTGQRVVLVDDLLATGGTLKSSVELVKTLGGVVVECAVIVELTELNGRKKIASPVYAMLQY